VRVALIVEKLERWRGGAETSVSEFVEHLAAAGVSVCCLTCGGERFVGENIEVRPVCRDIGPRWWRYRRFLNAAAEFCRSGDFDIVHAIVPCVSADIYQPRGGTVPETLLRNLAACGPAARWVKRLSQKINLKQRVMLAVERRLLNRPEPPVVAAVSSYVVRQVKQHYGLDERYVKVVFNGVNPDPTDESRRMQDRQALRRQWAVGPETVLFVTVAHNFRLKGVGRFIEAAARMRTRAKADAAFVVVGRGDPRPFRRLARKLAVAHCVKFPGAVQDVWAVYHAADVCVLNSYYDPCSRVVLEAMTAGLPCITTRYNGASDVIVDGVNGFVIDSPDDVEALADRMSLLLQRSRREQMGQEAARLRRTVSMKRHAAEMIELYKEVLAHKTQRGTR